MMMLMLDVGSGRDNVVQRRTLTIYLFTTMNAFAYPRRHREMNSRKVKIVSKNFRNAVAEVPQRIPSPSNKFIINIVPNITLPSAASPYSFQLFNCPTEYYA